MEKLYLRFQNQTMNTWENYYFGILILWEAMIPDVYKEIRVLGKFKEDLKKWAPASKCRLQNLYSGPPSYSFPGQAMTHHDTDL